MGGTDSTSFNNAGLPGIGMSQDPIEYNTLTHHTNLDTYERIVPDDVKKDAVIVAAQVLHLANRDEMLPRFTKEAMPPLSGRRALAHVRRYRRHLPSAEYAERKLYRRHL